MCYYFYGSYLMFLVGVFCHTSCIISILRWLCNYLDSLVVLTVHIDYIGSE